MFSTLTLSMPVPLIPTISTLSLHDALPIYFSVAVILDKSDKRDLGFFPCVGRYRAAEREAVCLTACPGCSQWRAVLDVGEDRKSTRLNSSHLVISYAVFCLEKKK